MKANDAIIADERHVGLVDELLANTQVLLTAGGSAQNSMRMAQWMMDEVSASAFVGCIGEDSNSRLIEEVAKKEGLLTEYFHTSLSPTGTCVCLLTAGGENRSLVASLGAARYFDAGAIRSERVMRLLQECRLVYTTGFFLDATFESVSALAAYACEQQKVGRPIGSPSANH